MDQVEEKFITLDQAMRGTMDGKQSGIIPMLSDVRIQSTMNGESLLEVKKEIQALRLDWAKAAGIVLACVTLFGIYNKYFFKP